MKAYRWFKYMHNFVEGTTILTRKEETPFNVLEVLFWGSCAC